MVFGVCTYVVLVDISNSWSVISSSWYVTIMKNLTKFYVCVYFGNLYKLNFNTLKTCNNYLNQNIINDFDV